MISSMHGSATLPPITSSARKYSLAPNLSPTILSPAMTPFCSISTGSSPSARPCFTKSMAWVFLSCQTACLIASISTAMSVLSRRLRRRSVD
ncbi:MAG: hypothetical protein A2W26_05510 [Acidobacteria bacterium RBG_16_64_8]|nr:MAG: hypothetical protein A2W26_05510 [Acidobacteria bacterium RBG_16_64_8]